jgi:putative phosphoesterase
MPASVAVICDIHGNLPALEAVLAEIRRARADLVVVAGDVLPGPMPRETMTCLLGLDVPVRFIHGNGDREVLAARRGGDSAAVPERFREALRWNARQLRAEDDAALAAWPAAIRIEVSGLGDVLICHATPRNDTEIFTRLTPEARLLPVFERVDAPVVVCGHTHMPFDRTIGTTRVINAGSVGMPFGDPGACWLLLGPGIHPRHTPYDLAAAAARIRATAYPQAEEFAARNVLRPPSEAEMLQAFVPIEIGA